MLQEGSLVTFSCTGQDGELAPFPGNAERERAVDTTPSACSRNTAQLLQVKTSLFQPLLCDDSPAVTLLSP